MEQDLAAIGANALALAQNAATTRKRLPLVQLSQALHQRADGLIAVIQAGHPSPSCGKRCSYCCHGLVPATIPELLELAQAVGAWNDPQRKALQKRVEEYNSESKQYWRYDLHHFAAPCPFLVEGECSVYEQRPLFCRGKSSYDPADCQRQMRGESVPLRVVPGQYEAGAYSVSGIVQGIKRAGRYSGTYDLGASMQILLDDPFAAEQLTQGGENPLNKVMMGSDANVQLKPINAAAKRFLMPELAQCFGPGVRAEQQYAAATKLARSNPYAVLGQLVLPTFYDSQDELEEWWNRYENAVDRLPELDLDPAVAFEAADLGAAATFGLAYCGKDVRSVMERLATVFHGYATLAHPSLVSPIENPRRPGKFRLGYVSRRLTFNNGSRWALGWVTEHSPDIETFAFNLNETDDQLSTRWRRNVDHYYHLPVPLVEAAAKIRSLDLDALIFTDVGSDGASFQLSLLRTARHQFAAWGFPMTTGSPEMDFYLSSEEMEPPNGQDHYTERLVKLPGSGQTFPKARRTPPSSKSATELGLPEGGFLLIAQNPIKLLPKRDAVYKEISERTGKPIVICDSQDGVVGDLVSARMRRAGVIVKKLPFIHDSDFFRVIGLADVVLDSFDFGGGITTVDALTLRKPPVSCPGEFMRGRLCVPFMKAAGVADMLTGNERSYIELACDPERISRAVDLCDAEPIYRDHRPVRALEQFLFELTT